MSEAERLSQRARLILAQIHALIAQDHMHENLLDRARDHHTRLVDPDPLVHLPTGVPLEERVQLAVVVAEQSARAGAGPGHGNVIFNTTRPISRSCCHIKYHTEVISAFTEVLLSVSAVWCVLALCAYLTPVNGSGAAHAQPLL